MPISVVVGGQFGSEGKGKVALEIARRESARVVVRVGGTNSGHTAVDGAGRTWALRQLPVAVLAPSTIAILPPGALIDPDILCREVRELGLGPDRVMVSPFATVISDKDKESERITGLVEQIGSTGSGTGAALVRRLQRQSDHPILAKDHPFLRDYLGDTSAFLRGVLRNNDWAVIEGTQGFGLSLLHGGYYPKATSRDTIAAAFIAEAGMSPLDVQDVTLVIRAHPIRVAGNSGELKGETSWAAVAEAAGLPKTHCELTTATRKIRRVGRFDPEIVRRAIEANNPTRIVLNHLDYLDHRVRDCGFSDRVDEFLTWVEQSVGQKIDWVGTAPDCLLDRSDVARASRPLNTKMLAPT